VCVCVRVGVRQRAAVMIKNECTLQRRVWCNVLSQKRLQSVKKASDKQSSGITFYKKIRQTNKQTNKQTNSEAAAQLTNDQCERIILKATVAVAEVVLSVDTVNPSAHSDGCVLVADEQVLRWRRMAECVC
jgi:hypothetical protein